MRTTWRHNLDKLDLIVESALRAARVPGAAVALAAGGRTIYARGFGWRDLERSKPMRARTLYPIASTTKAINATLLGILVDEGKLEWDEPVQRYLPSFRLQDGAISGRVTLRDLVTMRTGLPRHDVVWAGAVISRAELVQRLAHLQLSADFRQRFQYSNLSVVAAGHIAEQVTGDTWERLVKQRILVPLGMRRTYCGRPADYDVTIGYQENRRRRLVRAWRRVCEATAPSGGAIYSTVEDMARWLSFNLQGGVSAGRRRISQRTLAQIHTPQIVIGERPLAALPAEAAYALGWVVDRYNGHKRLSHSGYLHGVHSSVMLFPEAGLGIVSFFNFGAPALASLLNQHAFDALMNLAPLQSFEDKLIQYEANIESMRLRSLAVVRVSDTRPSHPLPAYAGRFRHPGYGEMIIRVRGRRLTLHYRDLQLDLRHRHYDTWYAADDGNRWLIHQPHEFDSSCPIQFHAAPSGDIAALSIPLEPEVEAICFRKASPASAS